MMTMEQVRENNRRTARLQHDLNEVNIRIKKLENEKNNAKSDNEFYYADYQLDLATEKRMEIIKEMRGY